MMTQPVAPPEPGSQSPWLQALSQPLQPRPCGEDPRYLDDFLLVKQEIDKLQGNDFPRVVELCRTILAETSRDLRLAGYLLLAAVYVEGIPGLLEAARGYRLLLERYGSDCHPQKEATRLSALNWLNNAKLDSYARQQAESADAPQLAELRQIIDAVNQHCQQSFGDQAPRWTVLDKWLQSRLSQLQPSPVEKPKTSPLLREIPKIAQPAPQASPPPALELAPEQSGSLGSERELVQLTRSIRDYLLQQRDYPRAVAYARALRWANLSLPPHQGGLTRVPAPRPAALNEVKLLLESAQHQGLFLLCEKLFFEAGGHFALDLQRHAWQAARALERPELVQAIADQTATLLRRLPELAGLLFDNGQPFADSATRQWLAGLAAPPAQEMERPRPTSSAPPQLEDQVIAARQLVQAQKLPAALGLLKTALAENDRQRLQLQLAMARLCLEAGRPEVAQPVLDELQRAVEEKALHLWDQDLALEVWTLSLECTRSLLQRTPVQERSALSEKMTELQGRICRIDLEAAARLF